MTQTPWVAAFPADDLPIGSSKLVQKNGCQVAVFRLESGQLYAVDNRCPHEGYPLDRGWVSDCVVTCPWHNFKFDLRDGHCLLGDEAVRTFPLRVKRGVIELDLTPPDPAIELPRLWASLEQAMLKRKTGQLARDVVRLLVAGVSPERIALEAARLDAAYAEYGTTHATPVAIDILGLLPRYPGPAAVLPLLQPLEMASDSHTRLPLRPVPKASPSVQLDSAGDTLQQLVENERADEAEALLRAALAAGASFEQTEQWLYRLCADHFLDFGHALIYLVKLLSLLERVGWQHAPDLLPAYLFGVVHGTREDLLPDWLWFRRAWDELAPREAELMRAERPLNANFDSLALARQLSDAPRAQALAAVPQALAAGASCEHIIDAISYAAAERILRFSLDVDIDNMVQEGWLDVTHLLTFACALRTAMRRYRGPGALRLLLYGARFVIGAAALDSPVAERLSSEPALEPANLPAILSAIHCRNSQRAISLTARYLADDAPIPTLRAALEDACLNDQLTRPIVVAHAIKTTIAAFDEHAVLPAQLRSLPILAAVRLLSSPIRERRVGRLAHEAVRFVVDGKVPKTLT